MLSAVWLAPETNSRISIAECSRSAFSHMQQTSLGVHGKHVDYFIPGGVSRSKVASGFWLHHTLPQIPPFLARKRDKREDIWAP